MKAVRNNIHLYAYPSKVAGGTCVTVGWDVEGVDPWVLESLRYRTPMYSSTHLDMTCVLYAVYESIRDKLLSGAFEAVKNKIHGIECGAQGSEFTLTIKCNHSANVVKKAVSAVVKNASPGHTYLRYVHAMHAIGQKPDKAAFYYCVDTVNRSVSKSIRAVITGKSKLDTDKLETMATLLAKKFVVAKAAGDGIRRTHAAESVRSPFTSVIAGSSLEAVVYKKYIEASLHSEARLSNGRVYIDARYADKLSSLGDEERMSAFTSKLMKLGDETRRAVMYLASAERCMSTEELARSDDKKFTADDIKRYLVAVAKRAKA